MRGSQGSETAASAQPDSGGSVIAGATVEYAGTAAGGAVGLYALSMAFDTELAITDSVIRWSLGAGVEATGDGTRRWRCTIRQ